MIANLIAVRCHFCSKERPLSRVHQLAGNAQTICDYCLDWHNRAIAFLAGGPIPGCQGCGATWQKLSDSSPGVETRLYVVPKDGIYQVLCRDCARPYVSKRADLYRGTAFGTRLNL